MCWLMWVSQSRSYSLDSEGWLSVCFHFVSYIIELLRSLRLGLVKFSYLHYFCTLTKLDCRTKPIFTHCTIKVQQESYILKIIKNHSRKRRTRQKGVSYRTSAMWRFSCKVLLHLLYTVIGLCYRCCALVFTLVSKHILLTPDYSPCLTPISLSKWRN